MTNRERFLAVLRRHLEEAEVDLSAPLLVVGAGSEDIATLVRAGFGPMTATNLETDLHAVHLAKSVNLDIVPADVEALDFPADAFETVFAHEVLHHCASPHRALCEMLRVARRSVVFLEPNDSCAMRWLVRLGLSFPYELMAVRDGGFRKGGVRDSGIPNFIFRWDHRQVWQTASAFLADREIVVRTYPYWDLGVDEQNLALRVGTRIGALSRLVGPANLVRLLRTADRVLNLLPAVRRQGNKIFCMIVKRDGLKPWLIRQGESTELDRAYGG